MKPSEYYQSLAESITEADVRRCAAIMALHIGQENLIHLDALARRIFGKCTASTERKTRDILEKLTTEYRLPVCSVSGRAGRWLAANDAERLSAVRELEARAQSVLDRAKALRQANVPVIEPPVIPQRKPVQTSLWR